MKRFTAEEQIFLVYSKKERAEGTLRCYTEISIYGIYNSGPVKVNIDYKIRFTPNEEYWEVDEEYPEEEPYSWSVEKSFKEAKDRNQYQSNWFDIRAQQDAVFNSEKRPASLHE